MGVIFLVVNPGTGLILVVLKKLHQHNFTAPISA